MLKTTTKRDAELPNFTCFCIEKKKETEFLHFAIFTILIYIFFFFYVIYLSIASKCVLPEQKQVIENLFLYNTINCSIICMFGQYFNF